VVTLYLKKPSQTEIGKIASKISRNSFLFFALLNCSKMKIAIKKYARALRILLQSNL
jgi:hypothetical protein